MKLVALVVISLVAVALGAPKEKSRVASPCDPNTCRLPSCRCLSQEIPGDLPSSQIPQLVLFTFDDAVNIINFEYYKQMFFDRTNPDGCPVSTTYFLSHEYTDYSKVHELASRGHEIALHSITHLSDLNYWDTLDLEGYKAEFGDLVDIIEHFANVPRSDIQGLRVPFLQLGGDVTFRTVQELNLTYDSSWPTQNFMDPPLWPYTLDYASNQDCPVGTCPVESAPGVWEQPMVDWRDDGGYVCSMVDACVTVPMDVDGILAFMKRNFLRHYESNKAPFGIYLHAAWFQVRPNAIQAYSLFLDYLQSLNDVYIVSVSRALEWVKNPQPLNNLSATWPACQKTFTPNCTPRACELKTSTGEYRYMTQCRATCPAAYPWLRNPLGNAS